MLLIIMRLLKHLCIIGPCDMAAATTGEELLQSNKPVCAKPFFYVSMMFCKLICLDVYFFYCCHDIVIHLPSLAFFAA